MFLGKPVHSAELEAFVDYVLKLLVDHGPYVSGAVNTIVTARAGRDLVSSLAAGLLTIGPRFGGAVNQAAVTWLEGVSTGVSPTALVEAYAADKRYISGIGHKKYRIDSPDPRVAKLLSFTDGLEKAQFTKFALGVEAETTRKKGNLILNVDGAMAAILLDLLLEKEGYSIEHLGSSGRHRILQFPLRALALSRLHGALLRPSPPRRRAVSPRPHTSRTSGRWRRISSVAICPRR